MKNKPLEAIKICVTLPTLTPGHWFILRCFEHFSCLTWWSHNMNLRMLFYRLFVFALSLGDGWDPNDRFNSIQERFWISNVICHDLICIQWIEVRGHCWWNCWLSLNFLFIIIHGSLLLRALTWAGCPTG